METESFDNNLTDHNNNKRSNIFYNITLSILTIAVIGLAYLYYVEKEKNKVQVTQNVDLTVKKDSLEKKLENMIAEYESLETTNADINKDLLAEKNRVKQLLVKLRNERNYSRTKSAEYEKELSTLRKIMRSYIVQIDSLNQSNIKLRTENSKVRTKYKKVESKNKELNEKYENANKKIDIASTLRALNISAVGLNKRGRVKKRISQVQKFKVCLTIDQNKIVKPGKRDVYLRIISPADFVLENAKLDSLKVDNENIMYSAKREIVYENASIDMCIFYQVYEDLVPGVYKIELYADGKLIGKSSLKLKDKLF